MQTEKDVREENTTPSIFLSYTHKDKTFAKRLAHDLEDFDINVWIDEAEIKVGDSLLSKIREGIDKVDYLGVILSPNSINSPWVQKEVEIAMTQEIEGKKIKVLPLLYKKCDLPSFLNGKLYADFTKEEDYIKNLKRILERVGVTSLIKDEEIYLRSVKRIMVFLSKSGFFYSNSFLTSISPLIILSKPETHIYPCIPFHYEFYKIPDHLVKPISELLIECFSNIWTARKSGHFDNSIEGSYVCRGNENLRRLRDSYVPSIIFDKAMAISLHSSTIQSKLKKLRSSKEIVGKENKAHYVFRNLELDDLFDDLMHLLSFIKGYNIGIPVHSTQLGEVLTWLLYNENEMFLVSLWSSYGSENEDKIIFCLNRSNNKMLMIYKMAFGTHSAFGDSISGLLNTLKSNLWIKESLKKDLEIWLVPAIWTISKEEISEIKGLEIEIKKDISKIDKNIVFTFFDNETLKNELIYNDLENFALYGDTIFKLIK
jgi:hypothetical protein